MKKIIIIPFIFISLNLYSKNKTIKSPGVEFLNCGQYQIRGLLGSDKEKSTYFLVVYPLTKRQYKIEINGKVNEFFQKNSNKVHVSASGVVKREGKASSVTLYLDKKLEVLNPNDRFKDVIVKKKDLLCI